MRIALINTTDYSGGAETVTRALHDGLRRRGHDSVFWVGRRHGTEDLTVARSIPCTGAQRSAAARYARKGFFSLKVPASEAFATSRHLEHVDLIHLHNAHGHYLSIQGIAMLAERRPLIWTLHDFFPLTGGCAFPFDCTRWLSVCGSCPQLGRYPMVTPYDRTRRMQSIKRKTFRDLEVTMVTPSRHLARAVELSGMFASASVQTIPYGVDTDVFRPRRTSARRRLGLASDVPVVLLAAQGLDDPRKGIRLAVDALGGVALAHLVVLLIGGGDVQGIGDALGGTEVRTFGYLADQDEMACRYAAADLVVFPSLAENFPCTVIEAMSCGTPVVAFDIDGVTEQIIDGRTGYLVPKGDAGQLARACRRLLSDRDGLRAVGTAAREYIERELALDRFLDRHEHLYQQVMSRHAQSALGLERRSPPV